MSAILYPVWLTTVNKTVKSSLQIAWKLLDITSLEMAKEEGADYKAPGQQM